MRTNSTWSVGRWWTRGVQASAKAFPLLCVSGQIPYRILASKEARSRPFSGDAPAWQHGSMPHDI
jgi:hypothetical protein